MLPHDVRHGRQFDVVFFLVHVVWHVDVHRSGATGDHRVEALPEGQWQHVHARGLERALHHRTDNGREIRLVVRVDLLERCAIRLRGRHVRGDGEECRRIRQCGRERHHQVCRARTGGSEGRDRLVLHAEIAVGHVAGALLVARRNEHQLVAHRVQRIKDADVAVATDTEDVRHLLLHEVFGDQFAAFHFRHASSTIGQALGFGAVEQVSYPFVNIERSSYEENSTLCCHYSNGGGGCAISFSNAGPIFA